MCTRLPIAILCFGGFLISSNGNAPVPVDAKKDVADCAGFIPHRKNVAMPGKIVAVLVSDAQAVLGNEGRGGAADHLCIGWNGCSYRWVYVPVDGKLNKLTVPLPDGKSKVYPKLSMATPATVKPWGIESPYALVEVEVNDGAGSPAIDSFVASKMTKLDGSKEYPIDVAAVIAELKKKYESHLSEEQKNIDSAMGDAAKKAIKETKPTGPREKSTLMFVTWLAETEKLQVRFLTKITDGNYRYGFGIRPKGGQPPPKGTGVRYGTQFGVELGMQYEVSKAGKVEGTKVLESQSFQKELPAPP